MSAPRYEVRYDVTGPVVDLEDLGTVHVLAAGGIGMSAVARLLRAAGATVRGSDARDSATLEALQGEGIPVHVGHDPAHLDGVDTVVVSSAIRDDNVELAAARDRGLRVLHRAQALASLTAGHVTAAVAGANGKTTTTSMLTIALVEAGLDPSFAVGGELAALGTNARLGSGDVFVVEADESDGSFLAYRPDVAIVTNVQPDHLDFYGTFEAVEEAYASFARTVPDGGLLVACADDAGSAALAGRIRGTGPRVLTYGFSDAADLRLREARWEGLTGLAELEGPAAPEGGATLRVALPGEHNLLNGAAAFLAATEGLGVSPRAALEGLGAYTGTRRRFELKGEAGGVTLVDDYAHNPGKVAALVATARRLATDTGRRLVVVFQPHLYSRTRDFASEFASGLAPADVVVVLDVYGAREDPIPGVSGSLVADELLRLGHRGVHEAPDRAEAPDVVASIVRPGDLLLTVGAGDVTEVGPRVLARFADEG